MIVSMRLAVAWGELDGTCEGVAVGEGPCEVEGAWGSLLKPGHDPGIILSEARTEQAA